MIRGLLDAESVLTQANRSLTSFWSGKTVGILTPTVGSHLNSIIGELECSGARVAVIVTDRADGQAMGGRAVWCVHKDSEALVPFAFERWLRNPSDDFEAWLDGVDPERQLEFVGNGYVDVPQVFGRPVRGWRRPGWTVAEDKTLVDSVLADCGIRTPPHIVGPVSDNTMLAEAYGLDRGSGVVLAYDTSQGAWGGTQGIKWIPSAMGGLEDSLRVASSITSSVRVAEFVKGTPCSVIGTVLRDRVIVFDPIELVTLRDTVEGRLMCCGSVTNWSTDVTVVEDVREAAHRVGTHLAKFMRFRGMFSLDGLLSDEGFLATEINPRRSGGLGILEAFPAFRERLFSRAAQDEVRGIFDLEAQVLEAAIRLLVQERPSLELTVPVDLRALESAGWSKPSRPAVAKEVADDTFALTQSLASSDCTVEFMAGSEDSRIVSLSSTRSFVTTGHLVAEMASAAVGQPGRFIDGTK